MVEIVVALAIISVMAGVMIAYFGNFSERGVQGSEIQNLRMLERAIRTYREDVGAYPSNISHLNTKPTTANNNVCGAPYTTFELNGWRGPYIQRDLTTDILVMETDTLSPLFARSSTTAASSTSYGVLRMSILNVPQARAFGIDSVLDDDYNLSTGPIRWTASPKVMTFDISIGGC